MKQTELIMRRRVVKSFIKVDSVLISVSRKAVPQKSGAGGYTQGAALVIPPQQARIILNKRRFNNGLVNSEAGEIPHTDYLLLAEHTKNFKADDEFVWLGENYKIVALYGARTESILCTIDLLGPTNR